MTRKLNCVLLIDDCEADNFVHELVIKKTGCAGKIVTIENGELAIEYLKSCPDEQRPKPEIIFLDINMPRMNGWEFLEEYKDFETTYKGSMIIVMLSTSINPSDEDRARELDDISGFINKPLTEKIFLEIVEKFF